MPARAVKNHQKNISEPMYCPLGPGGDGGVDLESYILPPRPGFVYRKAEIFTDGGCLNNPGPGGWGAIVRFPDGQDPERELSGSEPHTTNNRMELTGAVHALNYLQQPSDVLLTTDSRYLQLGISQWLPNWVKNNWRTASKKPVKNQDLWQMLLNAVRWHKVGWIWVRGHFGHVENERVDQLASKAIDQLIKSRQQ